ncbi:MAG TPA: hypothetical protein DDY32_03640, partial [Desulfobulbaceae bacterium]|nr:hypothetical protein [Desulfobulbaceae bacterium]
EVSFSTFLTSAASESDADKSAVRQAQAVIHRERDFCIFCRNIVTSLGREFIQMIAGVHCDQNR